MKWNNLEEHWLKINYSALGSKIKKLAHRSPSSIRAKARRMGLKRNVARDFELPYTNKDAEFKMKTAFRWRKGTYLETGHFFSIQIMCCVCGLMTEKATLVENMDEKHYFCRNCWETEKFETEEDAISGAIYPGQG